MITRTIRSAALALSLAALPSLAAAEKAAPPEANHHHMAPCPCACAPRGSMHAHETAGGGQKWDPMVDSVRP